MARLAGLLSLVVVSLLLAPPVAGQQGVTVRSSTAESAFPDGIHFQLEVEGTPDETRLFYEVQPDGIRTGAEADCASGGGVTTCRFTLEASRRNVLIPGAEVLYSWQITIGDDVQETPTATVLYEDDRFEWRSLSDGNLTVHWYAGDEEEARAVLAAGREALDEIGALLQTQVDFPVKIWYYASAQEMQPAIITDAVEGVITLGEVVYSDAAMVSADAAPLDITRHEIAHIVIREATRGPYSIPDWLNEGTAVYAQTEPLSDQRAALERAIETNDVFSVRTVSSASSGSVGSRVSLFYGQSWSLVDFLISTYGEEKFAELFRVFREGARTDDALQQVYGFTQDGLENEWRASLGLPPRDVPTPGGETTATPTTAPAADEDDSGRGDSDDFPVALVAAIGVLTVVLAGTLLGLGIVLARRYR